MTCIRHGFQRGSDSPVHSECVGARSFICSVQGFAPKKLAASEILTVLDDSMNVPTAIADTFDCGPLSNSQRAKAMDFVIR